MVQDMSLRNRANRKYGNAEIKTTGRWCRSSNPLVSFACLLVLFLSGLVEWTAHSGASMLVSALSDNAEIEANNLGQVAMSCAKTHCSTRGMSGLDLWISLEKVCFQGTTWEHTRNGTYPYGGHHPEFANLTDSSNTTELIVTKIAGGGTRDMMIWSPIYILFACLFLSVLGLSVGFMSGSRFGSAREKMETYPVA